ncbi:N-6 DNA methylase [Chryseobacterium oryctis]|uniref:N-6 DNA methylase n=1 Tax=Chryseobacterium oryctis TaxID=2952618 RepID=A0ABT3HS57_9FLAO|nr:N-6 DNA methylase [Chryseobacterium oryctis]MCW3162463.1 N-6 DNA methylase [Chryseobacterium oryctis]
MQIKTEKKTIKLISKERNASFSPEDKVRTEYVNRLIKHYGFSIDQMEQEVIAISSDKNIKTYADIVIWTSKKEKDHGSEPLIVVECKAQQVTIRKEDYYKGAEFASMVGAKFLVTANQKHAKVFSKIYKVDKKRSSFDLEEILNIPKADAINDEKEINALLGQTIEFARDDFSRLLFRCHNIIRNNDKLSPEAAFDEISKVLFIKTLYERENEKGLIYSLEEYRSEKSNWDKIKNDEDLPFYKKLFDKVKSKHKNDDLFESNETIRIRENSFEAIIKELEVYNLSTTSDDIKGIAFEQFLGRTFRGELGQFFTPRTIVDYMVEILDPQENETVCDPCCGSGGFLIKTFEYVRTKIEEDIQHVKEEIKDKYYGSNFINLSEKEQEKIDHTVNEYFNFLNAELDIYNPNSRIRKLSFDCIFGTDANPRMARTAKMNMIMHGDGHGGVHHHDGLINVNGVYDERFDIILTNPPFGARVEKTLRIIPSDIPTNEKIEVYTAKYGSDYEKRVIEPLREWAEYNNGENQPKGKSVLSLFKTGEVSSLTEVLFIERCLNLLKPGGRMAIVLPEGVLNNAKLQKVRDYVESKAKIINITSIPQDVFIASGATVKPSLLFFKKFTNDEERLYNSIKEEASKSINEKYKNEVKRIEKKLKEKGLDKEEKKVLREKLKQINQSIEDDIKFQVKNNFNYEIPIIEVEKAGISTTGAAIENELEPIAKEYKKYRIKNKLWKENYINIKYSIFNNKFQRTIGTQQPEVFYIENANDN